MFKVLDPHAMWDHLQQLHQPSDGTIKIFSYRTLMNMEMREGEPTDTFISNWQGQLDAAISAGNIIDETSKCEIHISCKHIFFDYEVRRDL